MKSSMINICVLTTIFALNGHGATTGLVKVDANFDKLKGSIAVAPAVPVPYKYLNFSEFQLGAASDISVTTLRPSSLPNFAVKNPLSTAQLISTNYKGSKTKSFDLHSLTTGCYVATENGAAAPPVNCTVLFTGTKLNGGTVKQTFYFGVGNALGIGLESVACKPVKFKGFDGLKQVAFDVTKATVPDVDGVTLQFGIDDVMVDVYRGK